MFDFYKKGRFTPVDSGLIFTVAFVAVNVVGFIFGLIFALFSLNEEAGFFAGIAVTQITIFLTCRIYCKKTKTHFVTALNVEKNFKAAYFAVATVAGIAMLYVFFEPAYYFVELLKYAGYVPIDTEISVKTLGDLILCTIFLAVLPAACEEILFRGIILQGLRRYGDIFAVIVSSAFFMLFHANPSQTLYPLLSGIIMGIVYVKTGNLIYSIIVHFINNFQSVEFAYFEITDSQLVAFLENNPVILALAVILFSLCLIYLFKQKSKNSYENNIKVFIPDTLIYSSIVYDFLLRNRTKVFKMSNGKENDGTVSNIYDVAVKLIDSGFEYNPHKNSFTLYCKNGSEEILKSITPPDGYIDASENPRYNPFAARKKLFFAYSLAGIVLCIASWLTVFFATTLFPSLF